jgi:hypothetical protein
MQVSKYRNELETLKKLTQSAPADKRAAYVRNFQESTAKIFASVRRNYEQLKSARRTPEQPRGRATDWIPHKELVHTMTEQARQLTEFRSTLAFARTENYRVREILVRVAGRRDEHFALYDREIALYAGKPNTPDGEAVARSLGQTVVKAIARMAE